MYDRPGGKSLKLIDFGFSRHWSPGDDNMSCPRGTMSYCAPEVLHGSYTNQADLWSMGVISFILLTGNLPFPRTQVPSKHIVAVETQNFLTPERFAGLSEQATHFVTSLLELDPSRRLAAAAALEHP